MSVSTTTMMIEGMENLTTSDIHHHVSHVFDIATGVGLPCTVQNCGDMIYRSTLDPELRRELKPLFTAQGAALLSTLFIFLSITPGALPGYVEYYVVQPIQDRMRKKYSLEDFTLGTKLGQGGFGVVYFATNNETGEPYVLKRADDYGEAEEWMNRRMQIAAWNACAPYVGSWQGEPSKPGAYPPLWLAWKYEGGRTLFEFMKEKDFPYNLEPYLFPDEESYPRTLAVGDPERTAATIRAIMSQCLDLLVQMHGTGIVHRDVKPENLIFDENTQRFKLIDFGGSADLRFGVNYVPKQFIFDPRYAAPEQYIMSTQTPEAPFPPIALALSPVLWQLNLPDRFDMYSLGIMYLQLCFKSLRTDAGVRKLRKDLTASNESLSAWRRANEAKIRDPEAWAILDANDQAGWEFARLLTKKDPKTTNIRHDFKIRPVYAKPTVSFEENRSIDSVPNGTGSERRRDLGVRFVRFVVTFPSRAKRHGRERRVHRSAIERVRRRRQPGKSRRCEAVSRDGRERRVAKIRREQSVSNDFKQRQGNRQSEKRERVVRGRGRRVLRRRRRRRDRRGGKD